MLLNKKGGKTNYYFFKLFPKLFTSRHWFSFHLQSLRISFFTETSGPIPNLRNLVEIIKLNSFLCYKPSPHPVVIVPQSRRHTLSFCPAWRVESRPRLVSCLISISIKLWRSRPLVWLTVWQDGTSLLVHTHQSCNYVLRRERGERRASAARWLIDDGNNEEPAERRAGKCRECLILRHQTDIWNNTFNIHSMTHHTPHHKCNLRLCVPGFLCPNWTSVPHSLQDILNLYNAVKKVEIHIVSVAHWIQNRSNWS